ncbi:MAG: hypothetical protein HOO06_04410 [Bdellovibrionaceae bacterium]|jgi:hypothetical protein|nr:hypothetical protein [Pseudobdellovibrionaceae bacterium]
MVAKRWFNHLYSNFKFIFISLIISVAFSTNILAENSAKIAILNGSETTNTIDPTDLNQSISSPFSMKWASSNIDGAYFEHSSSSFSHQVRIKSSGDYKLTFTLPYTLTNTSSNRRAIMAEVYVNGSALSYGRADSGYIRQASGHSESSLHMALLLDNLSSNDLIEIKVKGNTTELGKVTTDGAQLFLQYMDATKVIFSAEAKRTDNDFSVNATTTLNWSENIKDSGYTHSDVSSPQNISIDNSGDYMVYVNMPVERNGTCGSNDRLNPRIRIKIAGTTVTGGTGAQGYIRCIEGHDSSSLHWAGLVRGVTAGQVLTVTTDRETSATADVRITSGSSASIFIEKLDTSSDVISLSATTTMTGTSWNPSSSEVKWTTEYLNDATAFTHSTSTNSHQITINSDGHYLLVYNDHLTGTVARANAITKIKINNSSKNKISCKTSYIRNTTGHNDSSCSLTYLLEGLSDGDVVSVEKALEAVSGTVNDASPGLLTLIKVADATAPSCVGSIADCTPDKVIHIDSNDFTSILDESSRNANDLSFSGTVSTAKDISGSSNIHDSFQLTASSQPTFDTVNKMIQFDGVNDHFDITNHTDLNLSTIHQRTIVVAFKTGTDITSPQVIYEEGGGTRGMNAYILSGSLYIGFWNDTNDGDGVQAFTSASTVITANTHYYSTLVLDYSNYTGGAGPDGQLRGHINGVEFSSLGTTTSLLYGHSGAIAIGAKAGGTRYHTGSSGGDGDYFSGDLFELIIYNYAIDNTDALGFHTYLTDRWPDPQPATNLSLASTYTTSSSQTPNFSWTASISQDVNDYKVALGTTAGGEEISAYASKGNVTSTSISGLSLSSCTDYYASVKAVATDLDESTAITTEFLRFDNTSPSDPNTLVLSGSSSTASSKLLSWSSAVDTCSFAYYEAALGSSSGGSDIVTWTNIGNTTSHQFTGLSLSTATDYFISIRGYDSAGNITNVVSSVAWQVDTCVASDVVNPTDPAAFTFSGSASSSTTPSHSWSSSTDACGFSHYEMAVGTTSGASNSISWINIGDALTYKFFSVTPGLSTNQNYYSSIRSVDLAGNTSNVVSSTAWQLDSPGDVSTGLVLWLDANDSTTLFTDAGCSAAAADTSTIQCWKDKSSQANNATMGTSNQRPTYRTNQFNTLPVLRFDGSNDVLNLSSSVTTARTVFVVNKSSGSTFQLVLGDSTTQHFYTSTSTLLNGSVASSDLVSGSWRVDRTPVSSPTTFTQTSSYSLISAVANANVTVGNISSDRGTSGRYFGGDVTEVIIYNRPLDASEITAVENYLYSKWFSANPSEISSLSFDSQYSTNSASTPSLNWTHSTAPDLDHYEVALGTSSGSNDLSGWTNIGLVNSYQFNGLSMSQCVSYFASVRAVDTDGYTSSIVSSSFAGYDGVSPTDPTTLTLAGTANATTSKSLSWNPSTDSCSFSHYEVALGTSSGGTEVSSWASIGSNTSHQYTGQTLLANTDYYISVRGVDSASNNSANISSSLWNFSSCTDTAPPATPASITTQNNASLSSARTVNWSSTTDDCAFSHYELALGTTSGGSEVKTWTNVGNVNSYQFTNISPYLNYGTVYYVSVRGVDALSKVSGTTTTTPWTLSSPGGVSATSLSLWLDTNEAASIYQSAACTSPASNNDSVGCIKDKSGLDNHAVQSTSANMPVYKSSDFNGKPSIYFSGSSDKSLDFGTNSAIRTVFWVLKEDASNPGNTSFLLGDPSGATSDFHRDSTLGPIFHSTNSSASVRGGTLNLNKTSIDGTVENMPTAESVLSLVTSGSVTASSFSQDRTSCCGERTWGGSLAELIIFDRALNATEVGNVEDYLALKWGVTSTTTEWSGAVSTDWSNASNWSNGVPSSSLNCLISDKANDPVISSGIASCRDITISNGTVTLTTSSASVLEVYGNFSNTGTLNLNDNTLSINDKGVVSTNQTMSQPASLGKLRFSKTAGGTFTFTDTSLTVNDLNMASGSNFIFRIINGKTLVVPNGMTVAGGTFDVDAGGSVLVGDTQSIDVTGGKFMVSGVNDAFPQATSNKGILGINGSGRWGFNATGGEVAFTGFIVDYIDGSGLNISGNSNLSALDGGQFTHLLKDYSTPVKAIQLNTSTNISESVASNVGFNWGLANATFASDPSPADAYFLVYAPSCGSSALIFDQWFGDFYAAGGMDMETKIHDIDDSGPDCQVSIDISASPVNLKSFNAVPYAASVELNWETGAETDHLGFNIFRSNDAYGDYTQVNSELIRNFSNSTTFRGTYRYVDENLTDGNLYYYMIEDVSINGVKELHGPVFAIPLGALGAAPATPADPATNEESSNPPVSTDQGGGYSVITETGNSIKIQIVPQALTFSNSDWDNSYKEIYIPGYSKTVTAGTPELLTRTILLETDEAYTNVSYSEVHLLTSDSSAGLTGQKITPSALWSLDSNNVLQPNYAEDAAAYANDLLLPSITYEVATATRQINGKHFIEIKVWPTQYNPVQDSLIRLDKVVLELSLDGSLWDSPAPSGSYEATPASLAGNLRIKYESEGMYQLAYDDLVTANVEGPFSDVDLSTLRLYYHSKEIPIEIESADGLFNSGDTLRYFAPFEPSFEDLSDEIVLTTNDFTVDVFQAENFPDPLRIITTNIPAPVNPIADNGLYLKTNLFEVNNNPIFDTPIGGYVDHIYWARIFSVNGAAKNSNSWHDFAATLSGLKSNTIDDVIVTVHLRGRGVMAQNPKHELNIYINNNSILRGAQSFTGTDPVVLEFHLNPALFIDGVNNIRLESSANFVNSGDYDLMDINKLEVKYTAYKDAENGYLKLTDLTPDTYLDLGAFSVATPVMIYDVSSPYEAMKYASYASNDISGEQILNINTYAGNEGQSGKTLVLVEASALKTAASLSLSYGASIPLKDTANSADYIIVGPKKLISTAHDLIEHRKAQGLLVLTASVDQIYAEFSHGRKSAKAIRDFIDYSKVNYQKSPKYLLLLGDATYDPADALGMATETLMPVALEKGLAMDFASDNYFVESSDSHLPTLAVGRIPTNSSNLLLSYIDKLIDYENGHRSPVGAKARSNVMISGADSINENYDKQIDHLANSLSSVDQNMTVKKVYRTDSSTDADAKQAVINEFDSGHLFINYYGHGAENVWSSANMFNDTDAKALNNDTLPIVVALNCLNSYYYDADETAKSLGEELILNPNGGAIAFWGSTSQTAPIIQRNLSTSLMTQLGTKTKAVYEDVRIGDLFLRAKVLQGEDSVSKDALQSWTLFGDPALKLPSDSFSGVEETVDYIEEPSAPAPRSNSNGSGGGGCLAFAEGQAPKNIGLMNIMLEITFLLSIIGFTAGLKFIYARK